MINIRNIIFVFFTLFFGLSGQVLSGQTSGKTIYQKVKVHLNGKGLRPLAALGVEVEHGYSRSEDVITNFYSKEEVQQIVDAGFKIDILQQDAVAHYVSESKKVRPVPLGLELRDKSCEGSVLNYDIPVNFKYGSMGSYLTFSEIMAELDLMKAKYPQLISKRDSLDQFSYFKTRQNNFVQFVKISDNPAVNESDDEQLILYTALHHAREPMSMMQMIYFMWYILENYEKDPEIKYLLDKTELYFIPCVNPDGYIYNEESEPDGGGLWRKNRNNFQTPVGVDINRNYETGWGYDDEGSSPFKSSDTYRGPAYFSEAETKAIKYLFINNDFRMVINYHSFANVMIYPWGYLEKNTYDSLTYINFAQDLTQHTDYTYGLNNETLGYPINGTADDWMYSEGSGDSKKFSFTFECGPNELTDTSSFWPLPDRIQPMCEAMLYQNIRSLWLLNEGLKVQSVSDQIILPNSNLAKLKVTRTGLLKKDVNITVRPITDNVVTFNRDFLINLGHLESSVLDVPYQLKSNPKGDVKFEVVYYFGTYIARDTLTYTIHKYSKRFESKGDDLSAFVKQGFGENWELDTDEFYDTEASFALNNYSTYGKAENKILETKNAIHIPETDSLAFLSFYAKWFIEKNVDYLKVYASSDGSFYEPLCGTFSQLGNPDQGENDPVIDGFQPDWVNIVMDLSHYTGQTIYLKFIFRSDAKVNKDGINIDNIQVIGVPRGLLGSNDVDPKEDKVEISPNPAQDKVFIYRENNSKALLSLYDSNGKLQLRKDLVNNVEEIDVNHLTSGVYIYLINGNRNKVETGKFSIIKN